MMLASMCILLGRTLGDEVEELEPEMTNEIVSSEGCGTLFGSITGPIRSRTFTTASARPSSVSAPSSHASERVLTASMYAIGISSRNIDRASFAPQRGLYAICSPQGSGRNGHSEPQRGVLPRVHFYPSAPGPLWSEKLTFTGAATASP